MGATGVPDTLRGFAGEAAVAALLAALGAAPYVHTLSAGFAYDDKVRRCLRS
jgi:hypothetical protein